MTEPNVAGVSLCTSDYSRKIFRSRGFDIVSNERCCDIRNAADGEILFPGMNEEKRASGLFKMLG